MRTAMKHFTRFDCLVTRFVLGTITLHGLTSLSGFAFAQASSSDNATHFSYNNQAALDVKQVSVTVQDGVTVQDVTYCGGTEILFLRTWSFRKGVQSLLASFGVIGLCPELQTPTAKSF
jgi:hypothetical protein